MFDLENYLPYLVRRIVPRLDDAFGSHLKAVDITIETWRLLITLYERGPLSLTNLAELTSINLSTLSRMTDRMQRRKLIRRVARKEGSRRWAEIELLPLGVRKCEMLIPACGQLQTHIVARLSAHEFEDMKRLLRRLYVVVEDVAKARSDSAVDGQTERRDGRFAANN
jgi:DNA-binding MarR family transcriptional regulator